MKHLNGNILCVVHGRSKPSLRRTDAPSIYEGEPTELAFLPMDERLQQLKTRGNAPVYPFHVRVEDVPHSEIEYRFVQWFESLGLKNGKQLEVICFDAVATFHAMDRMITPDIRKECIWPIARDLSGIAHYINDKEDAPPRERVWSIPKLLKILDDPLLKSPKNSLQHCQAFLAAYRKLVFV